MARSTCRVAAIVALVFALAGCTRPTMPVVVVGPMQEGATLTGFERLLSATRAAGYEVLQVEARYGWFSARPHAAAGTGAVFEVQCYQDGSVQLRVSGVDRSPRSGLVIVPSGLRTEAVQFADVLHAGIGGPAL